MPKLLPPFDEAESNAVYALAQRDDDLGSKVKEAISIIEDCLQRFPIQQTSISFNGGKDCTVLIHILCAVIVKQYASVWSQQQQSSVNPTPSTSQTTQQAPHSRFSLLPVDDRPPRIKALYVRCSSPFPQVEEFIDTSTAYYRLELDHITDHMKSALSQFKQRHSSISAIIIGTRRSDPHGEKLSFFSPTDEGWPDIMRVHPVINWTYADVWAFLRNPTLGKGKGVPYCQLYDYGYTSLGSTHDTFPNPLLHYTEGEQLKWKPAWMLHDESAERAGREGRPKIEGNAGYFDRH